MGMTAQPVNVEPADLQSPAASHRLSVRSAIDTPGWNVVVTLPDATESQARRALRPWGQLFRTNYFHVLVMSVTEPDCFLEEFGEAVAATPGIRNFIARVFPVHRTFDFVTVEEFEQKASEVVRGWAPILGKRFHVRLHRHGLKGILSTPKEERFLDDFLLQAAITGEAPTHVGFDDADFIVQIETIDRRAARSLWHREDLARYPFLTVS